MLKAFSWCLLQEDMFLNELLCQKIDPNAWSEHNNPFKWEYKAILTCWCCSFAARLDIF